MYTMQRVISRVGQNIHALRLPQVPARSYASDYFASKLEDSPDKYTEVEKSFTEWKHVEKLLPKQIIPEPPQLDKPAPSGWSSPNLEAAQRYPYFVPRSKNHMIPVYFKQLYRGLRKETKIRHVEGNIWRLEEEVGKFLKRKYPYKPIVTHVHECARYIHIHGDYEEDVKQWLQDKGF